MNRHAVQTRTPSGFLDRTLSDDESLLIQLCEYLHRSGFLYDDSSEEELEEGEQVIQDFFNQESVIFQNHLSRDRLHHFLKYIQSFQWDSSTLKKRLRRKLLGAFSHLAQGHHHHFNVRRGILDGIQETNTGPLHDFLLFTEAYKVFFLHTSQAGTPSTAPETEDPEPHYSISDILKLRREVQGRLGVHQVIGGLLERIAKDRGTSVKALRDNSEQDSSGISEKSDFSKEPKKHKTIEFIRPSERFASTSKISSRAAPATFTPPSFSSASASMPQFESSQEDLGIEASFELEPELDLGFELEPELDLDSEFSPALQQFPEEVAEISSEIEPETISDSPPEMVSAPEPAAPSMLDLLGDLDDDEEEDDEDGLSGGKSDDNEVVFGMGRITKDSTQEFILKYPDSAIKFLLRRNIDGRPLPSGFSDIYEGWQNRGLSRKRVKQFFLSMMQWKDFPDLAPHQLLSKIQDQIYTIKHAAGEE